jgi:HAE1 family hydrophobic/amphiphilic exporter-1
MSLTRTVVNRPTTIFIAFVLLIGLGIFALSDLPIDLYPEIEPPILVVITTYEGTGPEEIEKSITRPLEGALSNVSSIEKIRSVSSEGSSMIITEFTWGTDMADAANSIRDNLEFVRGFLPDEADSPMIIKFDPSMIPIMGLTVTGNRTPEELREIAENLVQPRLEQVEGVAMTSIDGGRDRVIRVEISQNRLEAYDLSLTQVANMLRGQNIQLAAGNITEGNKSYLITTSGEYTSIDEIKNTVIAYRGQAGYSASRSVSQIIIRLRDIADVHDGYRDVGSLVYIDGKPGIQIQVQKQSGTNSVQTAEKVRKRLVRINREVPKGIRVTEIFNSTDIIENSLSQVSTSALAGALLAVVVLFLFLRSMKSTFIIGLTIPISLIITLLIMYFAGLTLNIMTLAGLALGIGMLVDNSIVILENIYRYREKGTKLHASAILGTQEMINAVVASTLTTICVFAPVAAFKGQLEIIGELFSGLSFTVVISLASSLIVALLLIPVLASHYLPLTSRKQRPLKGFARRFDESAGRLFNGLDELYKKALRKILKYRAITVLVILAVLIGSLFLIPLVGFEYMPTQQENAVIISVEMPIGTELEITESVLKQMEQVVKEEVESYESLVLTVGERSFFGVLGGAQRNKGSLQIILPEFSERVETSDEIKQKMRKHFNDFPSALFTFGDTNPGGGMMSASPIDILIKTDDLGKAKATAEAIQQLLEEIPEVTEPTVDMKEGLPQVEIFIDRDKAYSLGLNIYSIGQEIRANVDGITASRFRTGGSEYDILVILDEEDRDELPDLDKIFVLSPMGQRVPLASIAHYEKTTGPVDISRENQTRVVHVTAGIVPGNPTNEVEQKIQKLIKTEIPADEEVVIEFSGDYADLLRYGTRFIIILAVSILLVFGVMASQFESFLDPFIILFTIPLSLIGVVIIYALSGLPFSLFTAVGLVMLAGIIVNNGIVLVDYTNLLRKRGSSIHDACVEAGGNRLRPILMTTLTTVLALVPMAFFPGEGSELVQPIGKTVVGGLTAGTIFTLFLVPVIYAIFNDMSKKHYRKKEERKIQRRARRKALEAEVQG